MEGGVPRHLTQPSGERGNKAGAGGTRGYSAKCNPTGSWDCDPSLCCVVTAVAPQPLEGALVGVVETAIGERLQGPPRSE